MTTVFVSLHHQCFFTYCPWNPCRDPCFLAGERRTVTKGLAQGQAGRKGTGHRDSPSTQRCSSPPASLEGRQVLLQLRSKQLSRGQLTVCNQNQTLYCVSKLNLCPASQHSILSGLQTSEISVMRSCRAHTHTYTHTQAAVCSLADFLRARQTSHGLPLHRDDSEHHHHNQSPHQAQPCVKAKGENSIADIPSLLLAFNSKTSTTYAISFLLFFLLKYN